MQGFGYLHKCGNEPAAGTRKPKETLDLHDSGGGRPFYLTFIDCYSLSRDNVPQVCNLPAEKLTFGELEFQPSLFLFLEHGLQPPDMAGQIY